MTDSFIVAVSPPPAVPLLFWEKKSCHLLFNLSRSIVSILDIARVRIKPGFLINVWRGELLPGKKMLNVKVSECFFPAKHSEPTRETVSHGGVGVSPSRL